MRRANARQAAGGWGCRKRGLVVGHLGRLAPEKNLPFLARAVAHFLKQHGSGTFLVVGTGPSEEEIKRIFAEAGLAERLHFAGKLQGRELVEAYKAMDVFAFASHSETQGMVLAEAMAAGVPVVAVDAPGAREVVHSDSNGELIPADDEQAFADALERVVGNGHAARAREALKTAEEFSMRHCAERMLTLYEQLVRQELERHPPDAPIWEAALDRIKAEWDLVANVAQAALAALDAGAEEDDEEQASSGTQPAAEQPQ
jgi:1,2-diacylglycerol 3-alpha-glucosyltransferase